MRLGVSARRLAGQRLGVGRYIQYLLTEWAKCQLPFERVTLYSRAPVGRDILNTSSRYHNQVVASPIEPLLWEQLALPVAARSEDVLFCPSYTMPLAYRGRCVITNLGVYDHLPNSFPAWYRVRYSLPYRLSARRADLVLAISESAKRDLVMHYRVRPDRIAVIYPAPDERFRPVNNTAALRACRQEYGMGDTPFVLFVGKLSRRRHVPELIDAFAHLKRRHGMAHKLLIVGPDYLNLGIRERIARSGAASAIVYVPFVDHDDLPLLYNAAELYVLPTEHEGFSFTILEAMACGRAVVTLDHPALHEGLAEGAYCAISPAPTALSDALLAVLSDAHLRHTLEERALALSARFTWASTASRTLDGLQRVTAAQR
jgi:glycosyltransferase involved in cell wall biosynthesis